jgi:3-oxoacyl-[acyl-carrier-protein] synthase-3
MKTLNPQTFQQTVISRVSIAEAPEFISSSLLERWLEPLYKRLKLPEGRLELMTGVKTRGQWPVGTLPSDIAIRAGEEILADYTEQEREQIDLCLFSSVCRDLLEPATAARVHHHLGLGEHCMALDLSNACLGMVNAMMMGAQWIEMGHARKVLIVAGENSSPLIDQTVKALNSSHLNRKEIKKHLASLTLGSAGAAIILEQRDQLKPGQRFLKLNSFSHQSETQYHELCQGKGNPHYLEMETDSERLLHAGLETASKLWNEYQQGLPEFDHIIAHQVGIRHQELLFEKLALDLKRTESLFEKYGNTGSTAIFLALHQLWQNNRLHIGQGVLGLGIGSGLSCGMFHLEVCQ